MLTLSGFQKAGLTPNQSLYFLDSFAEKIEILVSLKEGHQEEIYLKLSKEKLAEIVEMAKGKKIEEAKLATKHYLEYLNRGFEENRDEKRPRIFDPPKHDTRAPIYIRVRIS